MDLPTHRPARSDPEGAGVNNASDDRIESREGLNLTLVFEHDVIDGAPAARFARRLVEVIESGDGLDEVQTRTAMNAEPLAVRTENVLV